MAIDFHGPNVGYVLELYERYREDPSAFDEQTRAFFANWTPPEPANGHRIASTTEATTGLSPAKIIGVANYIQAIRSYGHLAAKIDPLGSHPPGDPSLYMSAHGITEDDLRRLSASAVGSPGEGTAWDAVEKLRRIYISSIGYDYDHISNPVERDWLREAAESQRFSTFADPIDAVALLERLTKSEAFEHFLQQSFPTKYRFSIEGLDMMVPMLEQIIELARQTGTTRIQIGMAHRGRLNVMAHILDKSYANILAEFKDNVQPHELEVHVGWTGDVKYHKSITHQLDGGALLITIPPNPSHLELVNPVAVGMARAAGTTANHPGEPIFDSHKTLTILIHGDAAFPGQGIVAETLNLSQLPGYNIGGTIHIIANNQLGFTTDPHDGRSTLHASDLAKGFKMPIVHVNADDPEACIEVARLAQIWHETFEKDFVIDLFGYRRYGHNELDEPGYTQPTMYQGINNHPTVRQIWADKLIERGVIQPDTPEQLRQKAMQRLQSIMEDLSAEAFPEAEMPKPAPAGTAKQVDTAVPAIKLKQINDALGELPNGFNVHSKLQRTLRNRREALSKNAIDWATAEELAFASILADGTPIRLTGQDVERGTFSHRHAVLSDAESGEQFIPLQRFSEARASFEIHNSPLSESAALGFEYGYNTQAPDRLVVWEAQYGDFNNNAQTIIDEYIVSARAKWGDTPSLVMLLPHGYEGAGPNHSSAHLQRFLQHAARKNIRVANATNAAQYFHLLRRQARLLKSDPLPLVIFSPKSLLRHPMTVCTLNDLTSGQWHPVLDDPATMGSKEDIKRLLLCSGKIYVDLVTSEFREQHPEVAIVRLEQLYAFPVKELTSVLETYPNLREVVWVQEEPKNMGAWSFVSWRLEKLLTGRLPLQYVGRRPTSSPAEGSSQLHRTNQNIIIDYAYHWEVK